MLFRVLHPGHGQPAGSPADLRSFWKEVDEALPWMQPPPHFLHHLVEWEWLVCLVLWMAWRLRKVRDLPEVTWLMGSRGGPKGAPGWSCSPYNPGFLLPWGSGMVKYLGGPTWEGSCISWMTGWVRSSDLVTGRGRGREGDVWSRGTPQKPPSHLPTVHAIRGLIDSRGALEVLDGVWASLSPSRADQGLFSAFALCQPAFYTDCHAWCPCMYMYVLCFCKNPAVC